MSNTALKLEEQDFSLPVTAANDAYHQDPVTIINIADVENGKLSVKEVFGRVSAGERILVEVSPIFEGQQETDYAILENVEHPKITEAIQVGRLTGEMDDLDRYTLGSEAALNSNFITAVMRVSGAVEQSPQPREMTFTDMSTDAQTIIHARRVRASIKLGLRVNG